jgi:hypothetical protein
MKEKTKKLLFISLLLTSTVLVSCKKETTTRSVASLNGGGKCLIGRWPNAALPLTIKMSSEFTGDYNNSHLVAGLNPLEQMAQVWNNSVAPQTLITVPFTATAATGFASTNSFNDGEIGIYKSHAWFANVSSSALAITQFYGNIQETAGLGRHIGLTHADIIVNYKDYGSRITMTNHPMFEFDLPTIMLHELGHLLGMCHETVEDSIMAPYYISTRRSLEAYDIEHVNDIYVDGVISGLTVNTNALSAPVGSKVSGVIELHSDGKCVHYMNGKKTAEHQANFKRRKKQ